MAEVFNNHFVKIGTKLNKTASLMGEEPYILIHFLCSSICKTQMKCQQLFANLKIKKLQKVMT